MSDTIFAIQSPGHASPLRTLAGAMDAMGKSYALVRKWWRRYRSRLELASYSHDQRKDFGFSADVDGEIAKPFWKKRQSKERDAPAEQRRSISACSMLHQPLQVCPSTNCTSSSSNSAAALGQARPQTRARCGSRGGDALLLLAIGFVLWLRSGKISGPRAIGAEG